MNRNRKLKYGREDDKKQKIRRYHLDGTLKSVVEVSPFVKKEQPQVKRTTISSTYTRKRRSRIVNGKKKYTEGLVMR